ncbi:MAG: 50S ribosomal protein L6 [Desulfobacterales bacterium]|nr:50S ribosomal protein L6 [Desulfobacterales bacterium]
MSRIGKKSIPIPDKTKVTYKQNFVTVEGSKGKLEGTVHQDIDLDVTDNEINVIIKNEGKNARAFQGLTRSLVANMVTGVTTGFERVLQINGIGYRAETSGNTITLNLGFSHPINFELPDGISAIVEKNNDIKLSGIDKQLLGEVAASIRKLRPPEPYKGKGVKYAEERIQRKAGKTGAA